MSDAGRGDNIWVMNRNGSDRRQLSKEDFRLLNQPGWSPDGQFIVADPGNTEQIHRVMLGGRLYDPLTMNEAETGSRRREPYWWEADKP